MKFKKQKGLTFIEVLISIAIISLLMSISYPVYDSHVRSSYADGLKDQMLDMSNDFDRIKRKTFTYKAILTNDGGFNEDIAPLVSPRTGEARFLLSVEGVESNEYTIIATPTGNQGAEYGKLSLSFKDGVLVGKYDVDNDDSFLETWH